MMKYEEIASLIDKINGSCLTEFELEQGDFHLKIKTDKQKKVVKAAVEAPAAAAVAAVPAAVPDAPQEAPAAAVVSGNTVKSPLVGTFYNAPSPDAEPFVKVGDTVKKGQVLGIVEAMKLMNEVESEFDGVVEQILIENAVMVEYGQPLFVIR